MTSRADQWAAELAGEKVFYPGSKRPIPEKPTAAPRSTPGVQEWDRKPRVLLVDDKPVEFFTVGDLAAALGREAGTIRKWESNGVIPRAKYKSPSPSGDPRGMRRLYTRAQIEGIVRIALDEGILVMTDRRPLGRTKFTPRVLQLFKDLEAAQ